MRVSPRIGEKALLKTPCYEMKLVSDKSDQRNTLKSFTPSKIRKNKGFFLDSL